ncbi:Phosphotransferase enzyme family protein [Jannaschia aquimarina]|uniref:Phosphotransferase enzyme family protein n=1 Tax=Jannaschia aquimarina TaxID=935700 RepID=A0A0D1EGV9_9RHOB|nr:Phosphotransferase enzyme family protein [Jannaschia aquimarina]SNT13064.1 Predicted kinase, aminoglycoside phosphotransferase (APT) family [Jannaschia aquimarina]
MISPPNEQLIRRDSALPGLALLLDDVALAEALGTSRIERLYLRYKPGTSCRVAVRKADHSIEVLKAVPRKRFARKQSSGDLSGLAIHRKNPAKDQALPGARHFFGKPHRILRPLFGDHPLARGRIEILRYKAGRRLVARVTTFGQAALVKLHTPSGFARAQAGAVRSDLLGHAPLLGADASLCAIACGWLDGAPVDLAGHRAAGEALVRLHAAPSPGGFDEAPGESAETLRRICAYAANLLPELEDRLASACDAVLRSLLASPGRFGSVHGDFSADQVLVAADGARIVDWDRAGRGDQLVDLGSYLARLDMDVLDGTRSAAEARQAAASFLSGYGPDAAAMAWIASQHAAHLLRLVTEPFRRQLRDWDEMTAALLRRVADVVPRTTEPIDAAMPTLAECLDRRAMASVVAATGVELTGSPELLRHKPGRRAIVRLPCAAGDRLIKLRAKGPDRATPALHHTLREAGFDGRAAPFAIPRAWPGPDRLDAFLMEAVAGEPLADHARPGRDAAPFERAGRALAALHRLDVSLPQDWGLADEWAVLSRALRQAAEREPKHKDRIDKLASELRRELDRLSDARPVPLHRDFYFDQILIDGERMWLVDLDLMARGHPAIDPGNFTAHLEELALRRDGDPTTLRPQIHAFREGYADAGGPASGDDIDLMHRISLARHLAICLRIPGRTEAFPRLLHHLAPTAQSLSAASARSA